MVYLIEAQEYSFFLDQKESIQKKEHLQDEYIIDDSESFAQSILDLGQSGFFDLPKQLVVLKRVSEYVAHETVFQAISFFEAQGHGVVILETQAPKVFIEYIKKVQGAHISQPVKKEATTSALNTFTFTDFFLAKDKKNAWIVFSQLVHAQVDILQIQAGLFWALKTLYLVKTDTPEALQMKPYAYSKMNKVSGFWTHGELEHCLKQILTIPKEEQFDTDAIRMRFEQLIFSQLKTSRGEVFNY